MQWIKRNSKWFFFYSKSSQLFSKYLPFRSFTLYIMERVMVVKKIINEKNLSIVNCRQVNIKPQNILLKWKLVNADVVFWVSTELQNKKLFLCDDVYSVCSVCSNRFKEIIYEIASILYKLKRNVPLSRPIKIQMRFLNLTSTTYRNFFFFLFLYVTKVFQKFFFEINSLEIEWFFKHQIFIWL